MQCLWRRRGQHQDCAGCAAAGCFASTIQVLQYSLRLRHPACAVPPQLCQAFECLTNNHNDTHAMQKRTSAPPIRPPPAYSGLHDCTEARQSNIPGCASSTWHQKPGRQAAKARAMLQQPWRHLWLAARGASLAAASIWHALRTNAQACRLLVRTPASGAPSARQLVSAARPWL